MNDFEGCQWTRMELNNGDKVSVGVGRVPMRKRVALYASTAGTTNVFEVLGYFRDEDAATKAIEILERFIVSRPADARSVWDSAVPPGGMVCSRCGMPTESEPCREHQPIAYAQVDA